jgi:hypothetical protein
MRSHDHPRYRLGDLALAGGAVLAVLCSTATAALAQPWSHYVSPAPGSPPWPQYVYPAPGGPPADHVRIIAAAAIPLWQAALIALSAGLIAAAAAIIADRALGRPLQQQAPCVEPSTLDRPGASSAQTVKLSPGRW